VSIESADPSDCSNVKIFFNVVDPDGNIVTHLTPDQVALAWNNQPVDVFSLSKLEPEGSMSVIFAMDYSGSMTDGNPPETSVVEQAVGSFIDGMDLQTDYGQILKFNGEILWAPETLTNSREVLSDALAGDIPGDEFHTDIFGAAYEAVNALAGNPENTDRRAVILLSDGVHHPPDGSGYTIDDVKAAADNVPIFAIGLIPEDEEFEGKDVKALANGTGGLYFSTELSQLIDKYGDLENILLAQSHVISFTPDSFLLGDNIATLSVTLQGITGVDKIKVSSGVCP
jgi:hypothetical protein